MASAFKLLMRRGYRRIRVEDVAADAGVSKATVYHYFANTFRAHVVSRNYVLTPWVCPKSRSETASRNPFMLTGFSTNASCSHSVIFSSKSRSL
jgi:Bacterial regulatory proteins, tetR family